MNSTSIDKYIKEYLKFDKNLNKDDLIYSFKYQAFNELLNDSIDNLNDKGDRMVEFLSKLIPKNLITINLFESNTNEELNKMVEGLNMNLSKKAKLNHIITLNFVNKLINEIIAEVVEKKDTKSKLSDKLSNYKNVNITGVKNLKTDDKNKKRKKHSPDVDDLFYHDGDDGSDSDYDTSDEESEEKKKTIEKKKPNIIKIIKINPQYNKKQRMDEFLTELYSNRNNSTSQNVEIEKYYNTLSEEEQVSSNNSLKEIVNYESKDTPAVFHIMNMPLPLSQKHNILKQYNSLLYSRSGELKLRTWFDALMNIPFGKYKGTDLHSIKSNEIKKFLNKLQKQMDNAVFGHDEAKRIIIQMMGQQIKNPNCKGNVLGIWGCPGNGKSSLIKEGIAKAMDKPFVFISLGGASDSSFLEGHSYTYEGSIYGRIMNGIITSKCMNPIIYFDELDKISQTAKGEEITNILIHLTDPVQNNHFRDKYFHGIDIDLSKATFIFSFNDPSKVNHVLLDRITTVETKYLLLNQKINIAKDYLLPEIFKDMGMQSTDIIFTDSILELLINNYTREGGVRKLKSHLYNIIRECNIANLVKTKLCEEEINYPLTLNVNHINVIFKNKHEITNETTHNKDSIGVINGLWASTLGNGGIMPIEIKWKPSSNPLHVHATGNLQKVIKESVHIASTLAFSYLDDNTKEVYLEKWKKHPQGLHIHCPDGSVPKEGPSAGTALTVGIYSMLMNKKVRHDIAITGEITLQGNVKAIGGLENKLEGAKKSGIKLVLFPKENTKDIVQITERNATLFDDNFKAIPIETIDEAFSYSFV
jgi:ATP-dependent Lon protease